MSIVTGDPASMRAAAAQLRFRAETLGDVAATVDAGCASMTYAGPAADTFHANILSNGSSLRGVAARMNELADTLTREAAVLEEQLAQQAAQNVQQGGYDFY
jgi:hypothetical protein